MPGGKLNSSCYQEPLIDTEVPAVQGCVAKKDGFKSLIL